MGNKILVVILATFAMISTAFADNHEGGDKEKKPFSIYGDFAGSVQFLGNDDGAAGSNASRHDDFNVDLVELNVEKNWSHSKLHLGVGYGDTAAGFNSLTNNTTSTLTDSNGDTVSVPTTKTTTNITQAYYQMNSSYGLTFTFGKFASPMGYESYNHMDNTLFTRSYGYSNLISQFTTGLGINYMINPMFDVGFYAVNSAANQYADDNANKTMIATVGVNPMDNLTVDFNYMTGVDNAPGSDVNATVMELTAAYMVNDMINVALDYTARSTETRGSGTTTKRDASSIAAYVDANFGMFGAALRYEMLADDKNGLVIADNANTSTTKENNVNAITLGVHTEIDQNARLVLEYRTESADEKVWTDKDGAATDSQDMTTLGLMYRF